jgi:hypothetical protein
MRFLKLLYSFFEAKRIKYADTNKANIKSNKTNLDLIL